MTQNRIATDAVADEKFGSSKVHCNSVPAGTSRSCAWTPLANTSSVTALTKETMRRSYFLQIVDFRNGPAREPW